MNILFIVPYVPNLIRVRPYNLIRALSARGHRVTVATLYGSRAEQADLAALSEICHEVVALPLSRRRSLFNCLQALPTRRPLQAVYCWQPALAKRLAELVVGGSGRSSFDVIHVEHLRGARYGLALRQLLQEQPLSLPIVWDSVDSISHLFRQAAGASQSFFGRWVTRLELPRTERYEGWLVGQFDHVLVTSPADQEALKLLSSRANIRGDISVLANGVDLDYFQPGLSSGRQPAKLVISGKMSYHANVTMSRYFIQEIMPIIWAERADIEVTIVGKDPVREVLSLGEHPAVTVTGTVADIRPYLQQATVAVAPITYGAGIQNKVLEAMACATPVAATSQAVSALKATPGQDLLVADDPAGLAAAVLALLADSAERQRIGRSGRQYVEQNHHWPVTAGQLEEVYFEVVNSRR